MKTNIFFCALFVVSGIALLGCQNDKRSDEGAPGHTAADDYDQDVYAAESDGASQESSVSVFGISAEDVVGDWVGEMGTVAGEVRVHLFENGTGEVRLVPAETSQSWRYSWSLIERGGQPIVILRDVELGTTVRGTFSHEERAEIKGDSLSLVRD